MGRGYLTRERDMRQAYAAHSGELYSFAERLLGDAGLAEEAVEETFLRAWRSRDRLAPEAGSLRAWLFATLREVVADLRRARAARSGVEDDGVDPADAPLEQSLLAWRIEEAMRRIDEHQRQVLVDTFHRGRPCAEVAAELGVPEATVKRHVYEGLRALRGALAEVAVESWEPREHR